jgi:peptidoglycan/LPS O-acetylase OafA/YrhL
VLPLLAALIGWFARGSHRRAAGLIVALGVASAVLAAAWPDDPGGGGPGWRLSLLTTFAHLAVGMLLAVLRHGWPRLPVALRTGPLGFATAWIAAGLAAWVGLLVVARLAIPSTGALAAIVAIDLLLLGGCLLPVREGRIVRMLDARPLAAIGVVSYSLYAWHDPILRELASWNLPGGLLGLLAVGLPACAVVTVASYLLVERPGKALRRLRSPVRPRPSLRTRRSPRKELSCPS